MTNHDEVVVYSGVDDSYAELAVITFPLMESWAHKHGATFIGFRQPPKDLNPWWFGIGYGLELLRDGYKRIIRLDADQVITNADKWFDEIPFVGFHIGKDWGYDAIEPWHVSTCGFIAHQNCIPFFKSVLDMEPEWRDKPFQEQGPLREVIRRMMSDLPHMTMIDPGVKYTGLINIHPRKLFNSVPEEVCPGKIPEPWAKGDLTCHITMLPMDERLALIKKILAV